MEHEMRLDSEPFEAIKSGKKKREVRLNDEKRRAISVGDVIVFRKRPDCIEKLKVRVTGRTETKDFPNMLPYYPLEEQKQKGFVVFDIDLL